MIISHANRDTGGLSASLNLLRNLAPYTRDYEIMVVAPALLAYQQTVRNSGLRMHWFEQKNSFVKRFLFDTFKLPSLAAQFRPDAIVCWGHMGYPHLKGKQLIRFANLYFIYPPKHFGHRTNYEKIRFIFQKRQLRKSLKLAKIVYCQTPVVAERLKQNFKVNGRIEILPNSLSHFTKSGHTQTMPDILADFDNRFKMICLSRYNPHKNLEGILHTYLRHREKLRNTITFLTISPRQHRNAAKLLKKINDTNLQKNIVNLGPIPQNHIACYFKHCDALLFPTHLESFSASYLEAMHLGLPIITSDLDFARHICGPAALYCDPWSPDSIAQTIIRLSTNPYLQNELVLKGRQRLKNHYTDSWSDITRRIIKDVEAVINS